MTQEIFNELLRYESGQLFWRVKPAKQIAAGARAGTNMSHKYRQVKTAYGYFLEHRIIWIMHNGSIPEGMNVDHKDRNPANNVIENLRLATQTQNMWNTPMKRTNKSGYKGVSYSKDKNKWIAQIGASGMKKHLGYYETPELASAAYQRAANKLHGEFANNNTACV
jgi:hypothetical protein